MLILTLICIISTYVQPVVSDVVPHSIFGNNMVLQRDRTVPVWGKAEPGETVTVSMNGQKEQTTADSDGLWMVKLAAQNTGGPYTMEISGSNAVVFSNVMTGDVWVCSGQSNMAYTLDRLTGIENDINTAQYPNIRYFSVTRGMSREPEYEFSGGLTGWTPVNSETVGKSSAAAFYFARELYQETGVAIGLLQAASGGSVAEVWMSRESLESVPELVPIIDYWEKMGRQYPEAQKHYEEELARWERRKAANLVVPIKPSPPRGGPRDGSYFSVFYNSRIAPMIPYGITGVIWYQGESNTVRAYQQRYQLPALIQGWRTAWQQGDFPFLFVQLPNWETESWHIHGRAATWPEFREAQLMTLSVPKTGMAVTIDIGDPINVHPDNKWDVGKRLALAALHVAYGRNDIVYSGPLYRAVRRDGAIMRVSFHHTADGLTTQEGGELTGFTIAGEDRVFKKATARIDGNEVVVSRPELTNPAAVRYGWDDNPTCNLYNSAGLPASPFRTDTWPGVTDEMYIPYNRQLLYYWYPPKKL